MMSSIKSEVCDGEETEYIIDVDKLIKGVGERPPLWDKKTEHYSDRNMKKLLWDEVCESVVSHWSELSPREKQIKGKEVQAKWRNLRDCFSRDLAKQRTCKGGGKKKRKYIHFDSLFFLINTIDKRHSKRRGRLPVEKIEITEEVEHIESNQKNETLVLSKIPPARHIAIENSIPQISDERKHDEIDEDKSFALMLVPMFKRFNEEQKHFAKIEILNIMNKARHYHPPI